MSGTGNGVAAAATVEIVRKAGADGINNENVAKTRGVRQQSSLAVMMRLVKDGSVVLYRHSTRDVRYYLPEHAPKGGTDWQMSQTRRMTQIRDLRLQASATGEVIVPASIKVTQCPNFVDRRFSFDPPNGWVGEITRDWRARRLEGQR